MYECTMSVHACVIIITSGTGILEEKLSEKKDGGIQRTATATEVKKSFDVTHIHIYFLKKKCSHAATAFVHDCVCL